MITVQTPLIANLIFLVTHWNLPIILVHMEKELSEHNFTISDKEALKHLKEFMGLTTPNGLLKSLQRALYAYLLEQGETGLEAEFKKVVEDNYLLFEFLNKLND
ncbi:MAG: hypothetical protein COA32_01555 [Fluviicola sp.]|nr:MAG: hypothetical protein COA32_01555 [Fluviicola sp.]